VFAKSSSKVGSNIEYKYEWREGERGRSGEGKGGREREGGKDSFASPVYVCYYISLIRPNPM